MMRRSARIEGSDYERLVELHKLAGTDADGIVGELYEAACTAVHEANTRQWDGRRRPQVQEKY